MYITIEEPYVNGKEVIFSNPAAFYVTIKHVGAHVGDHAEDFPLHLRSVSREGYLKHCYWKTNTVRQLVYFVADFY